MSAPSFLFRRHVAPAIAKAPPSRAEDYGSALIWAQVEPDISVGREIEHVWRPSQFIADRVSIRNKLPF